jgi:hypothetical protein
MDYIEIDHELQRAVMDLIGEIDPHHKLPRSELSRVARRVIVEEKVADGDWIFQAVQEAKKEIIRKRNIAYLRGYAPFSCLNKRIVTKLEESFGCDMLELMKKYLKDPEDIYTKWAYRFAHTVDAIGKDICRAHEHNIYSFVTRHPQWEDNKENFLADFEVWITADLPAPLVPSGKEESSEEAPSSEVSSHEAPTDEATRT